MADEYDKKMERYQQLIPVLYKLGENPFVTALISAIAASDADVEYQLVEAGKQIFVTDAEKNYLDSLASNVGVSRPPQVNLSDDQFRQLIPALSYKPKQIRKTMYDVLDVFYGPLYSRANIKSYAKEPFNMGPTLVLSGTVTFSNGSAIVTGANTFFTSELSIGNWVRFQDHENIYFAKVASIFNDTSLRLSSEYEGGRPGQTFQGNASYYVSKSLKVTLDDSTTREVLLSPKNMENTIEVKASELVETINEQTNVQSNTANFTASVIEDPVKDEFYINLRTDTAGPTGSIKVESSSANRFAFIQENNQTTNVVILDSLASNFTIGQDVVCGSQNEGLEEIETIITNIQNDTPSIGLATITVQDDVGIFTEEDEGFICPVGDFCLATDRRIVTELQLKTVIYEINPKELVVRMPATVPSLRRTLKGSAHPRGGWYGKIISVDTVANTVTANMDSELSVDFLAGTTLSSGSVDSSINIVSHTAGTNGVVFTMDPFADLSVLNVPEIGAGTVQIDGSDRTHVVGTGTSFTTDFEEGDIISIAGQDIEVREVADDTNIYLCTPFLEGKKQIQELTLRGDTGGDLNNRYFYIYSASDVGTYKVWFNINGGGVEPAGTIPGATPIEIAAPTGATGSVIANLVNSALTSTSEFVVTNPYSNHLVIENVRGGASTKITDGNVGGAFDTKLSQLGTRDSSPLVEDTEYRKGTEKGFDTFAINSETWKGSYVFDPDNSTFTATSTRCLLKQTISKGTIQPTITVEGAGDFPDSLGWLIFDFGRGKQEVPVRYRGRPNNSTLLLDPAYIFKNTHNEGEFINLVTSPVLPTTPRASGKDFAAYVTGLREARLAVEDIIRDIKAAGVAVRFVIDIPDYLWTTGWNPEDSI